MPSSNKKLITVASRSTPLARVQVEEIYSALNKVDPSVTFQIHFFETYGDIDQKTSLRHLEKTDFFTKEIDEAILNGQCRIAIHSAKDLPDPLPEGLTLICMTRSINPSDALVMRPGSTLENLPAGALIATSSARREETVRQLRPDLTFCDLRGSIGQRLQKLDHFEADGVVIAEAALIRLGLTDLNRTILPGKTVEGQGQLAVVSRTDDDEMKKLFTCLDGRKQ